MLYGGLAAAVVSLLLVITYRSYLISIEAWSALIDTRSGFQMASVVLVVLAIGINGIALFLRHKSAVKK